MATTKNITMKQFNGTDYDTLYPKTIANQISGIMPISSGGTNGSTASAGINNLVSGLSQITPVSNDLFPFRDVSGNIGASVTLANLVNALGNNGVITPSNLVEQASALGFSRIQTGSYVGTGTYGSDNPCSLTFDFIPKFIIFPNTKSNGGMWFNTLNDTAYIMLNTQILTTAYDEGTGFGQGGSRRPYGAKSEDGKTIHWWNQDAAGQFNAQNYTYYWVAFG